MFVFGDNKPRIPGNSTIDEFIVVGIGFNKTPLEVPGNQFNMRGIVSASMKFVAVSAPMCRAMTSSYSSRISVVTQRIEPSFRKMPDDQWFGAFGEMENNKTLVSSTTRSISLRDCTVCGSGYATAGQNLPASKLR